MAYRKVKGYRRGKVRVKAYKRKAAKREHFLKAKKTNWRNTVQRSHRVSLQGLERRSLHSHREPDFRF